MDEQYEWGVKHNQGIRTEKTEAAARESLTWLTESHEKSFHSKVKPVLVRRTVTPWEPVED